MNKTEFREQFKRLRVSGYRLPVWEDVKVDDVMAEWYATFGACSLEEFSTAIDKLKQVKTDTFWPATGEIWQHIRDYRKERRIRFEVQSGHYDAESESPDQRRELLVAFRGFKQQLIAKMTMPDAAPQTPPQAVMDQEELEREAER